MHTVGISVPGNDKDKNEKKGIEYKLRDVDKISIHFGIIFVKDKLFEQLSKETIRYDTRRELQDD